MLIKLLCYIKRKHILSLFFYFSSVFSSLSCLIYIYIYIRTVLLWHTVIITLGCMSWIEWHMCTEWLCETVHVIRNQLHIIAVIILRFNIYHFQYWLYGLLLHHEQIDGYDVHCNGVHESCFSWNAYILDDACIAKVSYEYLGLIKPITRNYDWHLHIFTVITFFFHSFHKKYHL